MELSLAGKVALVTGTGPNIGSGLALALARYGAAVACNDLQSAAAGEAVDRIRRHDGTDAEAFPADVTDPDAVAGMVDDVVAHYGRIDILVANAAVLGGRGLLDETPQAFERAVRVTALGTFLTTQQVARHMASAGTRGAVVAVSSSNGWSGTPGVIAYAFHKGGVNNFVRAAAMDLAPYGIRINSVTPTAPTPDNPDLTGAGAVGPLDRARSILAEPPGDEPWRRPTRFDGERPPSVPMGTTGTPTDLGHAVAWLCSDYARLITGTDLVVDGGARARNFAYLPAAPEHLAGPLPLVRLDQP